MVLGLRSKGKKGSPVSLTFQIELQEIKPWPPSKSSSIVLLQWQRGDKRTGSSKCVDLAEKDKIVFNHIFRIPATLYKDVDNKKSSVLRYQKKCIVFSLFEVDADKNPKGQPLGRAVLDLAEYGNVETSSTKIPLAVAKREFSVLGTPSLSLNISIHGKRPTTADSQQATASSNSAAAAVQLEEEETHESLVAALMSDEEEIASFSDDESSVASSTPASESKLNLDAESSHCESPSTSSSTTTAAGESLKIGNDGKSGRVQRLASSSSVAPPSPVSSAAAAAATAYSEKANVPSSRASSSDNSPASQSPSPRSKNYASPTSRMLSQRRTSQSANNANFAEEKNKGIHQSLSQVKNVVEMTRAAPVKLAVGEDETAKGSEKEINVLQAARMKYARGADERSEKLERKALEEARVRAANAEAKAAEIEEEKKKLEMEMEMIKEELKNAAALELALYSAVAQHGSSPHKLLSPARRLARVYTNACKHSSQEMRASCARICASGLVLVARSCENDVSRLTFWWSNVVVFRGTIAETFDTTTTTTTSPSITSPSDSSITAGEGQGEKLTGSFGDWRETKTLTSTLERIEAWIFGRIVESIWWQSLTPHMQTSATEISSPTTSPTTTVESSVVSRFKKSVRGLLATDLGDNHQGNLSVELWKSAFLDAMQRICPVRTGGHDCGCLRLVTKMIVEQCISRLDVAMFNAILRDVEENVPTDPISDPISDLNVLPISPERVSFSGGAQLKNVINTWSTWLASLVTTQEEKREDDEERGVGYFTMLRAMSDLLMLPKDMLMDKSVRKEVCPALSLALIRRILSKFVADEFSPDPIPPSLLAAINAEISMEIQRVGGADMNDTAIIMASAPPVVYFPPSPDSIHHLIMASSSEAAAASSNLSRSASIMRKGNTSDDDLEEAESPLSLLIDAASTSSSSSSSSALSAQQRRYTLLRKAWHGS